MRALIALGGKGPGAFPMEASRYDRVVAADSGYDLLIGLGIMPDLVVGDLDSTRFRDSLIGKGIIPCSRDKDYTDAELAIRAAMPFDEYDIIGGGEGRMDHLLSIFALFGKYGVPRAWFTAEDVMIGIRKSAGFSLPADSELSFFPALPVACNVEASGLKWPFSYLSPSFISQSNRTDGPSVHIETDNPIFMRISPDIFGALKIEGVLS